MQRADSEKRVRSAVRHFWQTRSNQAKKQRDSGKTDQGNRGSITGGAHMDGFIELCQGILLDSGLLKDEVSIRRKLELPGYFRVTKEWDLLAIRHERLLAIVEVKSQVGSFGNNLNNRTEEALGSATDIWTAFREGAFGSSSRPWLGFIFVLEDCPKSKSVIRVKEPHYPVFPEFRDTSYMGRYEILFRKLVLERHYDAIAYIVTERENGLQGTYNEPAEDLTILGLIKSLEAHVKGLI